MLMWRDQYSKSSFTAMLNRFRNDNRFGNDKFSCVPSDYTHQKIARASYFVFETIIVSETMPREIQVVPPGVSVSETPIVFETIRCHSDTVGRTGDNRPLRL